MSACNFVVSARLVEAENMDCRLFKISCRKFKPIFAFKTCRANFPTNINCLHTTLYYSQLSRKASIQIFSLDESQ